MTACTNGVELMLALAPHIAPLLASRTAGLAERTPADLTFGNLWLFRRAHRWRWHDGPWPCLTGVAYDGQRLALPLFDVRQAPLATLRGLVAEHGGLFPLCEHEAAAVAHTGFELAGFELTNRRDDADYVYPAAQFRRYTGRLLQKKANLMAQLLAAHALDAKPYGTHLQHDALAVLGAWMHDKGKAPGDADEAACLDALSFAPELHLQGYLYRADGQPAGFLLAEPLQHGVWVVRFAKGLARFKGMAQYMFHHFAVHGPGHDGTPGSQRNTLVEWLNFEQDLGLPNFRQTKQSYRPAFLLPKWRLLPRATP